MSLFVPAKDVDADRSLCSGLDPGIGMTRQHEGTAGFNGSCLYFSCSLNRATSVCRNTA
jgi:hypothetical protein